MKKLLAISPLIGTLFTIILINILWEENPYGNIHDNGVIQWEFLLPVVFSSWILSTLAAFAAFISCYLLYRFLYHVLLRLKNGE